MDVFGGEIRRRDVFPLLVLHLIAREPAYGNRLIEAIEEITEGVISANPNTIYPLLRELEARGLIEGTWEHPDRRTRRYYSITRAAAREYKRLRRARAVPRLGDPLGDPDQGRGLRRGGRMSEVSASVTGRGLAGRDLGRLLRPRPLALVGLTASARWSRSEGYPAEGGTLRWRSTPAGRGEVPSASSTTSPAACTGSRSRIRRPRAS